jgi:hypothetical protein
MCQASDSLSSWVPPSVDHSPPDGAGVGGGVVVEIV